MYDSCRSLLDNLIAMPQETLFSNALLAITGAIGGMSKEKIYQELGLEFLKLRRWYSKLCLFCKFFKNKHPKYIFNLIPV